MKKLFDLIDRLVKAAASLAIHSDRVEPDPVKPYPSRVWVTVSRGAGGAGPIVTHEVELDEEGCATHVSLGTVDLFTAVRVRK